MFCAVLAGWVELCVAGDVLGFVGGEFEVGEVGVDGVYDTEVVGVDPVCAVVVAFDDEQHASFEVFGEVAARFEGVAMSPVVPITRMGPVPLAVSGGGGPGAAG